MQEYEIMEDWKMKCLNCNSENGEFFLFCFWKCWDCDSYSSSYNNNTIKAYYAQKRKYPNESFPNSQLHKNYARV